MSAPDSHPIQATRELCERSRAAARVMAYADTSLKNRALQILAQRLRDDTPGILLENTADLQHFSGDSAPRDGADAFADRLRLSDARIASMAQGVEVIATLDDPVGGVREMRRRPNGLLVGQVRIPLGVIGMIYEARPNVTVDAAALCIKSGNAVILRGGSEAARSNALLGELIRASLRDAGLPSDAVQLLPPGDRESIRALIGMTGLVDLVIPRGGEGLVRFVTENARVPVVQHYKGVCHLYVDEGADHEAAIRLVIDGKTTRPAVCNALECLLVHRSEAHLFLPRVEQMAHSLRVQLRGCGRTRDSIPSALPAREEDFGFEFSDRILAVKVVDDLDGALEHVATYGSLHTEAICTRSYDRAQRWLREVDASCVVVNASTRFNDGSELGLGAEIGISTSKLHAFGPMGLESLTSSKWIVYGEGQVRG